RSNTDTPSLHDALPILNKREYTQTPDGKLGQCEARLPGHGLSPAFIAACAAPTTVTNSSINHDVDDRGREGAISEGRLFACAYRDRKSTRLNSSHVSIS